VFLSNLQQDDLLIILILFLLFKEQCKDYSLYLSLILLLIN
jgi:hypothetical protein